ncbi:MAG: purine-binding chemotaxis protein CheW [Thermoanaerobacteraceae bacterium]|jgi:purine-binding chemotaxis protein CheW|nr:purine-binding chemotaxis protein CheW [Thermoanaerobacteraceae bacterium]
MARKLVVFELADELYGLNIFDVREIIRDTPATRIPRVPDFVEGIVNLRGKIIPVIDLKKRFGFEKGEKTQDTRIIIADISGQETGLVVDSVKEVATIDENSVELAPAVTTVNAAFVEGLAKKDDKLIIIIKLDLLLQVEEKELLKSMSRDVTGQGN